MNARSATLSLILASTSAAHAAERTVCVDMKFHDERWHCPTSVNDGPRDDRTCSRLGSLKPMLGAHVELWDKDGPLGFDDFIGTMVITHSGYNCATFEWENHPLNFYFENEANPDVYVKLPFKASDTDNTVSVQVVKGNGSPRSPFSFRDGEPGDADAYVANDCGTGGNCYIDLMVPTDDPTSIVGMQLMALDSVQRVLEAFPDSFEEDLTMDVPCGNSCPNSGTSGVTGFSHIDITDHDADNAATVGHEVGHVLHKHRYGTDSLDLDYYMNGVGSHNPFSAEYEEVSTAEGFASFVMVAAWYDDDNPNVQPRYSGIDVEDPTPQQGVCADNVNYERQVMKAFWDLVDANNEAAVAPATYADTVNLDVVDVINRWDRFDAGTANRQFHESDVDGPNLRDWFVNQDGTLPAGSFTSMLNHNCLGSMDND